MMVVLTPALARDRWLASHAPRIVAVASSLNLATAVAAADRTTRRARVKATARVPRRGGR